MLVEHHLGRRQVLDPVERDVRGGLQDDVGEAASRRWCVSIHSSNEIPSSRSNTRRKLKFNRSGRIPRLPTMSSQSRFGERSTMPGQVRREELGRRLEALGQVVAEDEVDRVVGTEVSVDAQPVTDVGEGPVVVEPHVQAVLDPEATRPGPGPGHGWRAGHRARRSPRAPARGSRARPARARRTTRRCPPPTTSTERDPATVERRRRIRVSGAHVDDPSAASGGNSQSSGSAGGAPAAPGCPARTRSRPGRRRPPADQPVAWMNSRRRIRRTSPPPAPRPGRAEGMRSTRPGATVGSVR